MAASQSGFFTLQALTDAGTLAASGRLYTYAQGTTTQKTAYTDAAGTIPHTYTSDGIGGQYIALNARGELPAPLYLSAGSYDIALKTSAGATVWTRRADPTGDLGTSLSASGGSALVGFIQSGTGAVARTLQGKGRESVSALDFGAVADFSTDNTAAIQLALNAVGSYGGTVHINDGVKFNLAGLTFPARVNLDYRADDDTSAPGQASDIGSGERVLFSSNSSYPADPTGGAVNEWRHTAPYHPGLIVDVRKDVTGGDANLAPGQSRVNPARASVSILDEQVDAWRVVYESFNSSSNFSQVSMHAWRRTVQLNGIGTAQWSSVPTEGTVITGTTSGAKGFLLSVAAGSTTVLWFSGKFVSGETLSDDNETTSATVTSVAFSSVQMSPISQGLKRGNWAVGLPSDAVRDMFAVGGKVASQQSRGTFYEDESITDPGYVWVDSYENGTPAGYEVIYDTVASTSLRRLWLTAYNNTAKLAPIGITKAKTAFSNTALRDTSHANVSTITRTGTGKYTIAWQVAFPFSDYSVCIGNSSISDNSRYVNRAVGSVEIWNYNAAGSLADLAGEVSVTCDGGDIG